MILRLSTFTAMTGATTLSAVSSIFDIRHFGLVVLFFFINLLAYEFILCGVGAVVIAPFCRENSRFSEETCELVLDNCFRVFFAVMAILMFLYVSGVFRLIPVPR